MTGEAATRRANETLKELAVLCAPEIAEALNEFKESSDILIFDPAIDPAMFVRKVAGVGVLKAAQTLRDEPGRSFLNHVKECTADVLQEAEADRGEELRSATPKQLLDSILLLSCPAATSILDRASFDQYSGLVAELMGRQLVELGVGLSLDLEIER